MLCRQRQRRRLLGRGEPSGVLAGVSVVGRCASRVDHRRKDAQGTLGGPSSCTQFVQHEAHSLCTWCPAGGAATEAVVIFAATTECRGRFPVHAAAFPDLTDVASRKKNLTGLFFVTKTVMFKLSQQIFT